MTGYSCSLVTPLLFVILAASCARAFIYLLPSELMAASSPSLLNTYKHSENLFSNGNHVAKQFTASSSFLATGGGHNLANSFRTP